MKYFSGAGSDLGTVSALPQTTFSALCAEVLSQPVRLPMTREAFHTLSPKERGQAKRVAYITAATFNASPCPRRTENAVKCNLIALDVDDGETAKRLIEPGALDPLEQFGFIAWHTASSTAEHPRLRIVVQAENLSLTAYKNATKEVGQRLGLTEVTSESLVPVQPMFLPTTFEDEEASPVIRMVPEGVPFVISDLETPAETPVDQTTAEDHAPRRETVLGDLDFYRAPMDGVTLDDAVEALGFLNPDLPMQKWVETGAALKHQFGEDGYKLWDDWSARGKKYVDAEETTYRWGTLKAQPTDRAPVTIRSLFHFAQEQGWQNQGLSRRIYDTTLEWLKADSRSSEELFDEGIQRISAASQVLSTLEQKALMGALRDTFKGRGLAVSLVDIRKSLQEIERESARTTGTPEWAKGWCFITSTGQFYKPHLDRRFSPEVMDLVHPKVLVGEDEMRPRDYLIKVLGVNAVENTRYEPAQSGKRYFSDDGVPYVNTYRPSAIISDPDRSAEAGDLIQRHLANLIREEEYWRLLVDFMAFHFQSPGQKVNWAPLIQSTKGAGKTFLAYMLSILLGRGNVKKVSNANVMENTHNEWAYGAQLAVLDEVRIIGQNRHAIMDKLKFCITDDEIPLRAMFEAPRTVPNIQNYLLFTNYQDALAIQDDERRYFVIASPLQQPEQIEAIGGAPYFNHLFGHVTDNPGGLRHFFENWPISAAFQPRGRAPFTKYLRELADNAASPLHAAIKQVLEDAPHPLVRRDLLSLRCLRDAIDPVQASGFSDQALASVLREMSWTKYGRVTLDGERHTLWTYGDVNDPLGRAAARIEVL